MRHRCECPCLECRVGLHCWDLACWDSVEAGYLVMLGNRRIVEICGTGDFVNARTRALTY